MLQGAHELIISYCKEGLPDSLRTRVSLAFTISISIYKSLTMCLLQKTFKMICSLFAELMSSRQDELQKFVMDRTSWESNDAVRVLKEFLKSLNEIRVKLIQACNI